MPLPSLYHGMPGAGEVPTNRDIDVRQPVKEKADDVGVQLAQKFRIQWWPKPWQRKVILSEHWVRRGSPIEIPAEQRFTRPTRWQGLVMTMK